MKMPDPEEELIDLDHPAVGCAIGTAFVILFAVALAVVSYLFNWCWGFLIAAFLIYAVVEGSLLQALELPEQIKAYRKKRWAKRGRCRGCGYSLHGSPAEGECPECGKRYRKKNKKKEKS